MYDIFLAHAWRYHDSWVRMVDLLDTTANFKWRNFSVPWYDPAFQPHTDDGYNKIKDWLESQIKPVSVILLSEDIYQVKSNQKWINLELEFAEKFSKPVVFVQSQLNTNTSAITSNIKALKKTIPWNADMIIKTIQTESKNI